MGSFGANRLVGSLGGFAWWDRLGASLGGIAWLDGIVWGLRLRGSLGDFAWCDRLVGSLGVSVEGIALGSRFGVPLQGIAWEPSLGGVGSLGGGASLRDLEKKGKAEKSHYQWKL